jgi:hypothetical protein
MEKEAPGYKAFHLGGWIAGILLHVAMIVGTIGLLGLRSWGWWASVVWAVLWLVDQVVTLAYLWTVAMPAASCISLAAASLPDLPSPSRG